jgi:hypothetical protein
MHPVLDNANTSSNVNSVTDNNLNDTPVPIDCEHKCHSLFQTNEEDKYTCGLCTRSNPIQREQIASGIQKQSDFVTNDIEDNVTIPIPNVDRGRGHPQNILFIVTL